MGPSTTADFRAGRLAILEDEIRRRLWDRGRDGGERDFDLMIGELARQQYASECQRSIRRSGVPLLSNPPSNP